MQENSDFINPEKFFGLYCRVLDEYNNTLTNTYVVKKELKKSKIILKGIKLISKLVKPEIKAEIDKLLIDIECGITNIQEDEIILNKISTILYEIFESNLSEEYLIMKINEIFELLSVMNLKNNKMIITLSNCVSSLTTRINGINVSHTNTIEQLIHTYSKEYENKDQVLTMKKN